MSEHLTKVKLGCCVRCERFTAPVLTGFSPVAGILGVPFHSALKWDSRFRLWHGKMFDPRSGRTAKNSAKQQHNDDDNEQETDPAAANPDRAAKNR
jgi:hypothetical protein